MKNLKRSAPLTADHLLFLSVVALAAIVLLYRLGEPALKNWDEAIYAEVAKEMLQTGDWITLRWQQAAWFEKPPLTTWAIAILFRAFAMNEFWARAISAFSGVGVVALTYVIGARVLGRACGVVAALILLTTFQFVQSARLLNTDVFLLLFIYLAIYCYLRVRDGDRRWWYMVSICCALGFLVKSFAVLVAPAAIGLAVLFDSQLTQTLKSKHFWFSILVAFAIVIPWHAAMYFLHGRAFVDEYFYYHVFTRTLTAIEGHAETNAFYLREIMTKFYPWSFIAPFGVAFHAWKTRNRRFSWVLLLLIAIVFCFYTAARTKLSWYMLPLYPALAVMIAQLIMCLYTCLRFTLLRIALILICLWFGYAAIGKIRSYYVKIEESDVAVKDLTLRATQVAVAPNLILFSTDGRFDRQSAMFYSKLRVLQATTSKDVLSRPSTRYQNYKSLADVVTEQPAAMLIKREDVEPLRADYNIWVLAESHDLVYGTISKKGVLYKFSEFYFDWRD